MEGPTLFPEQRKLEAATSLTPQSSAPAWFKGTDEVLAMGGSQGLGW